MTGGDPEEGTRSDGRPVDAPDGHLEDVPDGSGCTEIWEHIAERRDDEGADDHAETEEAAADD